MLEPTDKRGTTLDFTYPGDKVGLDSFLVDRMWQLLHSNGFHESIGSLYPRPSRDYLMRARERFVEICAADMIPTLRTAAGTRYFTFAGYLVNRAVALVSSQPAIEIDELSVLASKPIDWSRLAVHPESYQPVFGQLFESRGQSMYQSLLPAHLQVEEFLQEWLKMETIPRILERLARSTPVHMDRQVLAPIVGSV